MDKFFEVKWMYFFFNLDIFIWLRDLDFIVRLVLIIYENLDEVLLLYEKI